MPPHNAISDPSRLKRRLVTGRLDPNALWPEENYEITWPTKTSALRQLRIERPEEQKPWKPWRQRNTPLHEAIVFNQFESAKLLLEHGANINICNSLGRTPLHEAVLDQNHDAVQFLLEHGADIDIYNSQGLTLLHEAVLDWNHNMVQFLLEHDADSNAVISKCVPDAKDLIGPDFEGQTSLHIALFRADYTTLQLLIKHRAKLSFYDMQGEKHPWSALDVALLAQDQRSVQILSSAGMKFFGNGKAPCPTPPDSASSGQAALLLDIAQSNVLIPPRELYDVYTRTLQELLKRQTNGEKDLRQLKRNDINNLIQGLFQALREEANMESGKMDISERMCASCTYFTVEASRIYAIKKPGKKLLKPFKIELSKTWLQLKNSASKGCPLCSITADALDVIRPKQASLRPKQKAPSRFGPPVTLQLETCSESSNVVITGVLVECGGLKSSIESARIPIEDIGASSFRGYCDEDLNTGSAAAMYVAKRWLNTCQNHSFHAKCQEKRGWHGGSIEQCPARRLLYVGSNENHQQPQPRLVSSCDVREPYCALSYCWGEQNPLQTTVANLSQHMQAVPWDCMPPLILDAISAVREIGYRYLWIDALCIVQDDADDWNCEAANMAAIYYEADLTISSTVAANCNTGLFQPRIQRESHPVILNIWEPKSDRNNGSRLCLIPTWEMNQPAVRGPVHNRAWTLQEQLLSRKILWFSDGRLQWECLSSYNIEANPSGLDRHPMWPLEVAESTRKTKHHIHDMMSLLNGSSYVPGSVSGPKSSFQNPDLFLLWRRQLEEFTKRRITKLSDRLPAFASISTALASAAQAKCVAGIWFEDNKLTSLCWRVIEARDSLTDLACSRPSWSWLGVEAPITYDLLDHFSQEIITAPLLVSVDMQTNQKSTGVSGSLVLKGTLLRKRPFNSSFFEPGNKLAHIDALESWYNPCQIYLDHGGQTIPDCYAITVVQFPEVPLSTRHGQRSGWIKGMSAKNIQLLLERVDGKPDIFRRIGIVIFSSMPSNVVHLQRERRSQWLEPVEWDGIVPNGRPSMELWLHRYVEKHENTRITII